MKIMSNLKVIAIDMDGTIADLYAVPGWLEALRAYDPSPYAKASPMWDMMALAEALRAVQAIGVEIHIVTWLSKESTADYDALVIEAKKQWLSNCGLPCDYFHGVPYGTSKGEIICGCLAVGDTAMLIDDTPSVRKDWEEWEVGEAVDPTATDIVEMIWGLLDGYFGE